MTNFAPGRFNLMGMGCGCPMPGMGFPGMTPFGNPMMQMMMIMSQMLQLMSMMMGGGGTCSPLGGGMFPGALGSDMLGAGGGLGQGLGFPGYGSVPGGFPMPFAGQAPYGGFAPGGYGNYGSSGNPCAPSWTEGAGTTAFGKSVANAITGYCAQRPPGSRHMCYEYVANALDRVGVHLQGGSAYMAADQLARNPKFREVQVPREKLPSLPAGAIVVWAGSPATTGHGHGHISIALGDGRELSDRPRKQLTNYGKSFRVFLPK